MCGEDKAEHHNWQSPPGSSVFRSLQVGQAGVASDEPDPRHTPFRAHLLPEISSEISANQGFTAFSRIAFSPYSIMNLKILTAHP